MTETLRARRERFVRDHPARTAVIGGTPWTCAYAMNPFAYARAVREFVESLAASA